MKKMKKVFAIILALVMALAMAIPSFATEATVTKPSSNDKGTITVSGVETGATVVAYQITKAVYNDDGFTGYTAVDGVTLANVLSPTSDEVTKIAKDTTGLTSQTLTEQTDGTYTASVAPGYWVVIVTKADSTKVYNPMLAGVYYSVSGSDNTMTNAAVSAGDKWTLTGTDAYAKSSDVTVDKSIVDGNGDNDNGNSVEIGDTVTFKITTTIPDYSAQYTSATFTITDTLSAGFTPGDAPTVEGATAAWNGNVLTITYTSAYILANGGKSVEITYTATVNNSAALNYDANTNSVSLEYTNSPNETTTAEDQTYTYTFAIGADISAVITTQNDLLSDIIKVDEAGNVISTDSSYTTGTEQKTTVVTEGATFTLTSTSGKTYTSTTGADGSLEFTGLAEGTYTLVETAAPTGYTIDSTSHTVVITPTYNADGTLNTLVITIDGKETANYTGVYENGKLTNVTKTTNTVTNIANTKLSSLPSTGGIGTTIFTVVGCAIIVAAGSLLIVSRRKRNA